MPGLNEFEFDAALLSTSGDETTETQVADATERLNGHPAYKLNGLLNELLRMIDGVFVPNWRELLELLEAAASNERLAMELIQNVHSPAVRNEFERLLSRRLFNHLASSMGLVDHVRRIVKSLPDAISTEFAARTTVLLGHAEIGVMQDLRNYTLHRALPFIGHTLRIENVNHPDQKFESEIELSIPDLLDWDGWRSGSRGFLKCAGESLQLRPIVHHHGKLVYAHNTWLSQQIAAVVNEHVGDVNALLLELQVARSGWPRDVARQMMDERTARNDIPVPDQWISSPEPDPPPRPTGL